MRVFIGAQDICGLLPNYKKGFEQNGYVVTLGVYAKNPFFKDHKFDLDLGVPQLFRLPSNLLFDKMNALSYHLEQVIYQKRKQKQTLQIIKNHDLFVFLWGRNTLFTDYSDLKLIKESGKKIISIFVGSDVRHHSAFVEEFKLNLKLITGGSTFYDLDINPPLKCIRTHELYSDIIYSVPDQSSMAIRPYNHVQLPIDLNKYQFLNTKRRIPKIIHAPSRTNIKGTKIIIRALQKLKNEGLEFEFENIWNVSNSQLKLILSESDILIDQLNAHGPGVLGFEAMASGCAVATRYLESSPAEFNPPLVSINEINIVESLRNLIVNQSYRVTLIDKAYDYLRNNNSCSKVVKKLILDLDNVENLDCQYHPNFFITEFKNESNSRINSANKKLTYAVLKKMALDDSATLNRLRLKKLI